MADVSSLLSTLLSGGDNSGMQALANAEPMTGATVLARLRGANQNNNILSGLNKGGGSSGKDGGLDTAGSKFGAIASGLSSGMKEAADKRAEQQKQAIDLMKMQWEQNFKTAELKQKIDSGNATAAENKRYHDILDKYYTGQNNKKDKDEDLSSPTNIAKVEQARRQRATTEGLFDKALINHSNGSPAMAGEMAPDAETVKAAQAELAARRKAFSDWDSKQSWNQGGKSGGVPKVGEDTGDTGDTAPPAADPNAETPAAAPTPPTRPTDLAPPAATTQQDGTSAPAAPRSVTGPDGKKYTWTPDGGLQPATPDVGTPADPTPDSLPAFGQ